MRYVNVHLPNISMNDKCNRTFTVLHISCVMVIQQYRKMRQHGGRLLREGREHAEVSEVLDVVVCCSLGGISGHG